MTNLSCAAPVALATLVDYWLAELPAADEQRIEEHLLGCAACTQRLGDLAATAGDIRTLIRQGVVRTVITGALLERLAREGLRVKEYALAAGGSVQCTVTADDDLVATRLAVDMRGVARLDLSMCDAAGNEQDRLEDLPVSVFAREVVVLQQMARLRALPARVNRVRLLAVDDAGERLLGEYTFIHTPSGQH
jgi:hypothetical protein